MNCLFTSEEVVEICDDGSYHSKNLNQHCQKYREWGNFYCVCYSVRVKKSLLPQLDENITCIFTQKQNSLTTFVNARKNNKQIIRNAIVHNKIDFLICHVPSDNSYHAIHCALKIGLPYITVVVGCAWDAMWNYDWRGKILALPAYLRLRHFVSKSPYVIYVTKEFLERRYPSDGRVTNASNVQISELNDSIIERRIKKINKSNFDCLRIVTVADVDVKYKGQEYVIKALSELKKISNVNYVYYLIGGGNSSYLNKIANKYGVQDCVRFVGALSHDKVLEQLDEMDICIHPSKQEGLPRALIEAMSRALPSIGTKVAGIPELLPQRNLVRKGSVSDIVSAILQISNKEVMLEDAKRNFVIAADYSDNIINQRRRSLIQEFVLENNLTKTGNN